MATFGHLFGRLSTLFGIKVETRVPADAANNGNCIYIANHQNNYDMVTASNIVQPRAVTVGKKSGVDPVFGPLYWLTGNLLMIVIIAPRRTAPSPRWRSSSKERHFDLDVPGRDPQPRSRADAV